ncbi:MAG TPA: von Willebrand factor type A domain-containing protein, partial [Oleiagrimonas sp.]|nr:von Willebrand factor type A domain-containing protein [Oleiagrimonas sp.]
MKLPVLLLSLLLTLAACSTSGPARHDAADAISEAAVTSTPVPRASPPLAALPASKAMHSAIATYRPLPRRRPPVNRENYAHYESNPVHLVTEDPVSTFGVDVDTGSYTNVRRMLNAGHLPPADAVRAEELINYFDYGYQPPAGRDVPFSVTTELAPAPWNRQRQLLLIGIQGYRVPKADIPAANLVFLIDTSGSMRPRDKLPLLKASLKQLVRQLDADDHVAIVTYAGSAGVALASTAGNRHAVIDAAIDQLDAGGSTNGGAGLRLAYQQARAGYIEGGINRVILATDGDFNVGTVDRQALKTVIKDQRKSGIALSTLGFGRGNYNEAMAMTLADVGNGSYHYIDSLQEGRRVLGEEMAQTLLTIAKDVKIQVEFNPAQVAEYRLIGYVKRKLTRADFNN